MNTLAKYVKLYYFSYLSIDRSFAKITLNAVESEYNYRVIGIEDCPPSARMWCRKLKNSTVSKESINKFNGVFHYEMFCTEDNLLPLLRELYLMYTNYADETKERLAEIENHMRIIVGKAMNPI